MSQPVDEIPQVAESMVENMETEESPATLPAPTIRPAATAVSATTTAPDPVLAAIALLSAEQAEMAWLRRR